MPVLVQAAVLLVGVAVGVGAGRLVIAGVLAAAFRRPPPSALAGRAGGDRPDG